MTRPINGLTRTGTRLGDSKRMGDHHFLFIFKRYRCGYFFVAPENWSMLSDVRVGPCVLRWTIIQSRTALNTEGSDSAVFGINTGMECTCRRQQRLHVCCGVGSDLTLTCRTTPRHMCAVVQVCHSNNINMAVLPCLRMVAVVLSYGLPIPLPNRCTLMTKTLSLPGCTLQYAPVLLKWVH